DADDPERLLPFREPVIDIGAQSMQRKLSLQMPLAAGDFGAVQAAADLHFDSLRAEAQRLFHGLSHGATKSDSFFELGRNLLSLQLRVQFRLVNLLNRDEHFTTGARRNVRLELVDFRTLTANDDARTRSVDDDLQAIGR